MQIGLVFAIAGAFAYGLASVLQASATGGGVLRTIGRPLYVLGLGLDLAGWLLSLAALRSLSVVEVQTILAGSLAVTALAARAFLKTKLRLIDVVAVALTTAALAVLAATSPPASTPHPSSATGYVLLGASITLAAGGALAALWSPSASALVAGVAFGGAALCARVVTFDGVFTEPAAWAIVVYGVTGMLLYAHALERGSVGPVTALLWIAEVVAPGAAGALLFGDPIPTAALPVSALIVALVSAVVLANAPQPGTQAELKDHTGAKTSADELTADGKSVRPNAGSAPQTEGH